MLAKTTLGGSNLPLEASHLITLMASSFGTGTKVRITSSHISTVNAWAITVAPSSANKTGPLTGTRSAVEIGDTLAACMCQQLGLPYVPGVLGSTVCGHVVVMCQVAQGWRHVLHRPIRTSLQSTVEALGRELKRREGYPSLVLEDEVAGAIQGLTGAGQGSTGSVKQVSHLNMLYDGKVLRNTSICMWCCFSLRVFLSFFCVFFLCAYVRMCFYVLMWRSVNVLICSTCA